MVGALQAKHSPKQSPHPFSFNRHTPERSALEILSPVHVDCTAPEEACGCTDYVMISTAKKAEFSKNFVLNAKFLEVSHQTSLVAKVPNRYFGSRVTTCAELNEIAQYSVSERACKPILLAGDLRVERGDPPRVRRIIYAAYRL
jgi:hypothetical protein